MVVSNIIVINVRNYFNLYYSTGYRVVILKISNEILRKEIVY